MIQSIKVSILGKQIPLKVEESEVENTRRMAKYVDEKFKLYRNDLSNQPDSTIMILACLSLAEELFEARRKIEETENSKDQLMDQVNNHIEQLIEDIS